MPEEAQSTESPSEPQANGLTALYVPFCTFLFSFPGPRGLVWARNPRQQVTGAVARLSDGSSMAETVNKRAAQHRPDSLTRTVEWAHSPNLARVRYLNNG